MIILSLITAIKKQDIHSFKILVKKINFNEIEEYSNILMHVAINNINIGNIEIIEILIDKGVKKNERNGYGFTPLQSAVVQSKKEVVNLLLKKGVEVNKKDLYGFTALHLAVEKGDHEMVKLLLDHGAKINKKNNKGYTPLELAILNYKKAQQDEQDQQDQIKIVELLLKRGDINKCDQFGCSPLHLAASLGHSAIVFLLLKHKAKVDVRNQKGYTPLDFAIMANQIAVVRLLLDGGMQLNQCCISVLKGIIMQQKSEMVELLKKYAEKEIISFISDYLNHLCPFIEIKIDGNQNIQLLDKNTCKRLSKEEVVEKLDEITGEKFEKVYELFFSLHVNQEIKPTLEKYRGNPVFKFIKKVFVFLFEACSSKPRVSMTHGVTFFNQLAKSNASSFLENLEETKEIKPALKA